MSNSFRDTELYKSVIHLVNVIPDENWDGWEDSSQARLVGDAVLEVLDDLDTYAEEIANAQI